MTPLRTLLVLVGALLAVPAAAQPPATTSDSASIAKALHRGCANGQVLVKDSTKPGEVRCATPGGSVTVPGTGTEVIYRVNGTTLGAVTDSSFAAGILEVGALQLPTGSNQAAWISSGTPQQPGLIIGGDFAAIEAQTDVGGQLVLGGTTPFLTMFQAGGTDFNQQMVVKTRGTVASPLPVQHGDEVLDYTINFNTGTGSYNMAGASQYTVFAVTDGMGNWGAQQNWGAFGADGASATLLKFNALTGGIQIESTTGTLLDVGGTTSGVVTVTGAVTATGFKSPAVAFSGLPTCDGTVEGTTRAVTDSTTATWGATITGTGSNHVLAYCNGTNWTVAAK